MPVTLLATHHRRRVAIAHAMLSGTPTRPSLIVVEDPEAAFIGGERAKLEAAVTHPAFRERASWLGVNGYRQIGIN